MAIKDKWWCAGHKAGYKAGYAVGHKDGWHLGIEEFKAAMEAKKGKPGKPEGKQPRVFIS